MTDLRLVIFDVDGTLVDSQSLIVGSMRAAFDAAGIDMPARSSILDIVGLSLDNAMRLLLPDGSAQVHASLVEKYKEAYFELRKSEGEMGAPFYDGVREVLEALRADPWTLLGIATGKSKRGVDALIESHSLGGYFDTVQVADFHPSKPHPSMILTALKETGIESDQAVMIGDTSYDMEMARAASVRGVGVSWGYHAQDKMGVEQVAETPAHLLELINTETKGTS